MKTIRLGVSELEVPSIAVGCMRLNRLDQKEAEGFIRTALENGANFFDHADIYGDGECERLFARAAGMNSSIREQMTLQSKCGMVMNTRYDQSKEYILSAVDGILRRLKTEYLDVLLLHKPDALVEPEEVAEAFDQLHESGKVRYFGVSNHDSSQIELLKAYVRQPVLINQIQMGIVNSWAVAEGMFVNMPQEQAVNRSGNVLNYCRKEQITIQAWSPFQYGYFDGIFVGSEKYPELNARLNELAEQYGVTANAIAVAWLLRHPARIQPILGTTSSVHLKECLRADEVCLTRDEWYSLFVAAGNFLP